ncbi:hypothetical protein R2E40_14455 [Aeromonas sp. CD]|nr:hypothetical protein [Aeromonas sp. CD]WOX51005.1 hypothetical protein R2E40_14455 [Aeromonas sp. CD]
MIAITAKHTAPSPTAPLCCCGELGISIRIEAGHVAIDEPDYSDMEGGAL